MNHQFIYAFVIIALMVVLIIINIVINYKNYQAIKEIRESIEAGNTLRDKLLTTITDNEEVRKEDFKEHIEILGLIRKNTNKKDSGQKKDFKKPSKKNKNFHDNQQKSQS